MREPGDNEGEYAIDVSARPAADQAGFVGRVVVRRLPSLPEVFREELLDGGRPWALQQNALAAAFAKGRQVVRLELCRRSAERPSANGTGS